MAIIIPTTSTTPHYTQLVDLDGSAYRMELRWNDRVGQWSLGLETADGERLVAGLGLVPNIPLLRKLRHERRPPGELMVLDERGVGITRDNLGSEVVLIYGVVDG